MQIEDETRWAIKFPLLSSIQLNELIETFRLIMSDNEVAFGKKTFLIFDSDFSSNSEMNERKKRNKNSKVIFNHKLERKKKEFPAWFMRFISKFLNFCRNFFKVLNSSF